MYVVNIFLVHHPFPKLLETNIFVSSLHWQRNTIHHLCHPHQDHQVAKEALYYQNKQCFLSLKDSPSAKQLQDNRHHNQALDM